LERWFFACYAGEKPALQRARNLVYGVLTLSQNRLVTNLSPYVLSVP
jgi:hypothetical protein